MIEHEQRILLETAKIAKKKKFDYVSTGSYTVYLVDQVDPEYEDDDLHNNDFVKNSGALGMTKGEVEFDSSYFRNNCDEFDYSNKNYTMYAAPTQSILAKWLREAHDIHVEIYANASGWGWMLTKTNGTTIKEIQDDIFFATYEIAMEFGLQEAMRCLGNV